MYVDPYQSDMIAFLNRSILIIGHHAANSPNHFKMLGQMGIDNMHHFLLQNKHAYFIHRSDNMILPWYLNYLYRTKGVFCRIEQEWQKAH